MNQTTTSTKRQRPHKDDNNTPPTNPKRNKQQPIPQQPIPEPQHDATRICIQTSRSRLSQRPLDKSQHAMADECVAAARPLMVHRPPLGKMFGKEWGTDRMFQSILLIYLLFAFSAFFFVFSSHFTSYFLQYSTELQRLSYSRHYSFFPFPKTKQQTNQHQ